MIQKPNLTSQCEYLLAHFLLKRYWLIFTLVQSRVSQLLQCKTWNGWNAWLEFQPNQDPIISLSKKLQWFGAIKTRLLFLLEKWMCFVSIYSVFYISAWVVKECGATVRKSWLCDRQTISRRLQVYGTLIVFDWFQ